MPKAGRLRSQAAFKRWQARQHSSAESLSHLQKGPPVRHSANKSLHIPSSRSGSTQGQQVGAREIWKGSGKLHNRGRTKFSSISKNIQSREKEMQNKNNIPRPRSKPKQQAQEARSQEKNKGARGERRAEKGGPRF